jgi:hypothetical protein
MEETPAPPPPSEPISHSQKKGTAPVRIKPGYTIRKDLIRECKRIALETEKKVYQVMEEALVEYIENYNKTGTQAGDERKREM